MGELMFVIVLASIVSVGLFIAITIPFLIYNGIQANKGVKIINSIFEED